MTMPTMLTIRQTAKTGILPEHCLRAMAKKGELPCVYSGTRCLVNYDRLCEMLNQLGSQNGGEAIER
jgi:hypothetical protein